MSLQSTSRVDTPIVRAAEAYVRAVLAEYDGSHDFAHIQRVCATAVALATEEGIKDLELVCLGALLHDIYDFKYSGSETAGPEAAEKFLTEQGYPAEKVELVRRIVEGVSFRKELADKPLTMFPELAVVQDADRLDAIGAIGIARCFTFGGSKNRPLYDEAMPARVLTRESYAASGSACTINHFYEKLLLLKDLMKTPAGRARAEARHQFMLQFLDQFAAECRGDA